MKQNLHIVDDETKRVFDELTKVVETSEDIIAISYALITCLANAIVAQANVNNIPSKEVYMSYGIVLASVIQRVESEVKENPVNYTSQESKWKM